MLQKTLSTFGFPDTLVKEYDHWIVLCRNEQQTLGSLILVSKEEVTMFSELSKESFGELQKVIKEIEETLKKTFQHDRINYLAFMMYNPLVHMSIIPRYATDRVFAGHTFRDFSWPGLPDLSKQNVVDQATLLLVTRHLQAAFAKK